MAWLQSKVRKSLWLIWSTFKFSDLWSASEDQIETKIDLLREKEEESVESSALHHISAVAIV